YVHNRYDPPVAPISAVLSSGTVGNYRQRIPSGRNRSYRPEGGIWRISLLCAHSAPCSTRQHGPEIDDDSFLNYMIDLVQIDGGRAISRHQLHLIAHGQLTIGRHVAQQMLLCKPAGHQLVRRELQNTWQHKIRAHRLLAAVEHKRGSLAADHRR